MDNKKTRADDKDKWVFDPCEECDVGSGVKVVDGKYVCRKCAKKLKKEKKEKKGKKEAQNE